MQLGYLSMHVGSISNSSSYPIPPCNGPSSPQTTLIPGIGCHANTVYHVDFSFQRAILSVPLLPTYIQGQVCFFLSSTHFDADAASHASTLS